MQGNSGKDREEKPASGNIQKSVEIVNRRCLGSLSISFIVASDKSIGVYLGSYMFESKIFVKITK